MDVNIITDLSLLSEQAAFFYLGQEGILLKHQSEYLVIDPYLTDYVDRNCCSETVTWKRIYPSPLKPEDLSFIDYIVLTHEHYDHADPDTLRGILSKNEKVKIVAPAPICDLLRSYSVPEERILKARADVTIELGAYTIDPVPAAHEELHKDKNGDYKELGYRISFGKFHIFHAGDCCLYPGLEEKVMDMNVMFLPVNGRSYYKLQDDIIGNMTAEEAVLLAKRTNTGLFVPIHHDLYEVNRVTPVHIVDTLDRLAPTQRYHLLQPGEYYILG